MYVRTQVPGFGFSMSKNINTYHVKALKILILSPNVKLRGLTYPLLSDHMVNLKKIKVNFSKEKNDVLLLRQEMAEMSRIFTLFLGPKTYPNFSLFYSNF